MKEQQEAALPFAPACMLPLHNNSKGKSSTTRSPSRMHRNVFSSANGGSGAYPLASAPYSPATAHFSHKFAPKVHNTPLRRRRQLIIRLTLLIAGCLAIASFLSESVRGFIGLGGGDVEGEGDSGEWQVETVRYYDLSNVQGTARGWEREERILLCAPLRDAAPHLPMFFSHLRNLTYPHNLIDLAFLVGDSKDATLPLLSQLLEELQAHENPKQRYGEISIMQKDFGQKVKQDVESRHGFAAQAGRRKSMAQARNWLLSAALRPTHSWVYWRDVDVETAPFTILEDLMRHNKDVIVPSGSSLLLIFCYERD